MLRKNLKWIMLILSGYYLYLNLKNLAETFAESDFFSGHFFFMAVICATLAYLLGRSLLKSFDWRSANQPAENKPAPKKTEPGKEMTELDLFVIYNREALDRHLAAPGRSIVLKNGFNSTPCNFSLVCKKNSDGNYEAKIFPNGSEENVPYDENNLDHQKLYRHFRLVVVNYQDDPRSPKKP